MLAESVTGRLQLVTAVSRRNGAAIAVTTGLIGTMGLPASSANTTSARDRAVTASIVLAPNLPADVVTGQVSADTTAHVRFERPAFVATQSDGPRANDGDATAHAAADVIRASRSLARVAYREQQAKAKPEPQPERATPGVSGASCSISSRIESHLTSNARSVYRAVCAAFGGSVSSFGGYRAGDGGDHGSGRALDIMVSGQPGWSIARYLQTHARELGVSYVIYEQKIWQAGNPTSQWKTMEDRGSSTANHYDHVHVSVT